MRTRGEARIDPGTLEAGSAGEIDIVVAYTDPDVTRAVVARAAALTKGLNVRLSLVAVHTVPYSSPLACPAATHAFLVARLLELCSASAIPASGQVVMAHTRDQGFRHALKPASIVLIGARKRPWLTHEEKLGRVLRSDGHQVTVIHVE
jgi:hypothetical protein